ncbi:hypothetical protein PIROE2DRAFT_3477 [Piromyces sp. E2]|nr:hypothetical protein PIROE2DRAFT_3477 [Piromyces sp. E2]|eukprot:OUM68782.1 hypothetical protein PIROE2DRAFT_3477 [Piromyces sp. E2]
MEKNSINAIRIITGCSIPIFWAGVISFGYPGVMSTYWQERYHVGTTETGLVVTFMLVSLALTMFISGRIHSKFGMPLCIIIGVSLYVIAFIFLFLANNIYVLYVWAFIENIGCSFTYGPGLTTVQKSFPNKKGLVSGIINLTFGIAAAIMSPILNVMLEGKGYNFVNIIILSLIVISDIISFFLVKCTIPTSSENQNKSVESNDMTVKQALKSKEFWLIWFVWAFMGASGISMISLSKSYSIEIGRKGVLILTIFNLANGISRIFIGILTDVIGARITGVIGYASTAIGYLFMPHTSNIILICLCAVGVGIGFGTIFTVTGPLASDIFGLKNFGVIYGLIFTAYGIVGGIVGPPISGLILEKTENNYTIVFTYLGIMAIIGTVLTLFVKEKKKKTLLPVEIEKP